ncbi:MAG: hypothetical protein A2889_08630 [Nitrospinae bacterium RIFCSPLOWO2_01_FULL_39_10]|nr:MAG: hypothetical protein A2889_08630 [Nitrospinae bacterium RIFCSPLOWO2_01_FULL_39_10]
MFLSNGVKISLISLILKTSLDIFSHMIEKNIVLFISTHETLRAEKILKSEDIYFKTVIKPRSITSECGMGLEFNRNDKERILKICKENNLKLAGIFFKRKDGGWERIDK